jgi:hypothetical protein
MASVTYDHVTKKFGDVVAVNDLNNRNRRQEFWYWLDFRLWKVDRIKMLAGWKMLPRVVF